MSMHIGQLFAAGLLAAGLAAESAVSYAAEHAEYADQQKANQHKDQQQSGVAGKWTMTVDAGPHGATAMALTLKQDGTKVSGTFASPHGDMPVDGEFVDGVLKLSTNGGNADSQITFEATLKDGKLSGYLSSQMGDMKWTAERVNSSAGL
jgi:hypothetical protein